LIIYREKIYAERKAHLFVAFLAASDEIPSGNAILSQGCSQI